MRRYLQEKGIQSEFLPTERGIGVYNYLAWEGRHVAAGFIPDFKIKFTMDDVRNTQIERGTFAQNLAGAELDMDIIEELEYRGAQLFHLYETGKIDEKTFYESWDKIRKDMKYIPRDDPFKNVT